jgi:hypothetical protein
MGSFLDDLKNAVDTGKLNSDAAKKILEISDLADTKLTTSNRDDLEKIKTNLEQRLVDGSEPNDGRKITEEEVVEMNSIYDEKMEHIRMTNIANNQLATLIDIEDMILASIGDMFTFLTEIKSKFDEELNNYPEFSDLNQKINKIEETYSSIINK